MNAATKNTEFITDVGAKHFLLTKMTNLVIR